MMRYVLKVESHAKMRGGEFETKVEALRIEAKTLEEMKAAGFEYLGDDWADYWFVTSDPVLAEKHDAIETSEADIEAFLHEPAVDLENWERRRRAEGGADLSGFIDDAEAGRTSRRE
jgi:hypothetical protein